VDNETKGGTCPDGTFCGWDAAYGYYDCISEEGGEEPEGIHPMTCSELGGDTGEDSSTGTETSEETGDESSDESGESSEAGDSEETGESDEETGDEDGSESTVDPDADGCASHGRPPSLVLGLLVLGLLGLFTRRRFAPAGSTR